MRAVWLAALVLAGGLAEAGLPEGLGRFNPAGLPAAWTYEGTAFHAFASPARSQPTQPVLRLRHPSRGYALAASEAQIARLEREGFVREGIAFHAPREGPIAVYGETEAATGVLAYAAGPATEKSAGRTPAFHAVDPQASLPEPDRAALVAVSRYREAGGKLALYTAARESPYQVGAFYFGSYSRSARNIAQGVARVHGRKDDWWGGVSDFYGREPGIRKDPRDWAGEWPGLKPAIGYYDQARVDTLRRHIRQASDAGLAFFSFYWYWSRQKGGELLPEALASFLEANVPRRMRFNLALYAHPWDDDMALDESNAPAVVDALVGYFARADYLRLPDGRPVFVVGDHRNVRDGAGAKCAQAACFVSRLDRFLAQLKLATKAKLGVEPFVQVQAGAPGWDASREAGGVTCLVPPFPMKGGTPYPAFDPGVFKPLANAGKPVSPCMLQNFDERPRQDILVADRAEIRYLVGKTDALFRQNLAATKRFVDAEYARTGSAAARIVYLYAWNEWHEGGVLEPNVATGARDLNIVTDVFQLPRAPSACLDEGRCD